MSEKQKQLDICRTTTIYEAITAIMKDQLTIEEMEKMLVWLSRYVAAEKEHMRRK